MRKLVALAITGSLLLVDSSTATALEIPKSFARYATSPALGKAGIIVLDPVTQEPVFEDKSDVLHAPASILKLLSTTTALNTLGAETRFNTSLFRLDKNSFALVGERDPWLSTSARSSRKYHRAFSPELINKIIRENPRLRSITLKTSGIYANDISNLRIFYGKRLKIVTEPLADYEKELLNPSDLMGTITSPTVAQIIKFTLLWSDNVLAERLARTSAKKLGLSPDEYGIQSAFVSTLEKLNVPTQGLQVFDGSGLSHENRISPRTIATLLLKIKDNPEFSPIVNSLPTAGETGTLKKRFITDAPNAIGLVHAKTGWINGTVSLAGYVTVGDEKYPFTIIASHLKPSAESRTKAKVAMDRMLETIASPSTKI